MKRYLLLFILISSVGKTQVVFCPPGSEWNYLFEKMAIFNYPGYSRHEQVKYMRDSIINSQSVKVLQHTFAAQDECFLYANVTVIRQNGDTVFFRSRATKHTWQILYNFAATQGQNWVTNLSYDGVGSSPNFTMTVESVTSSLINSIYHRVLYVKDNNRKAYVIYERFGADQFLFNFWIPGCDGLKFKERLCYYDNTVGEVKYSGLPCDFENPLGFFTPNLAEYDIKTYPNPFTDYLKIESSSIAKELDVYLSDLLGNEVLETTLTGRTIVDLHGLKQGMYLLEVREKGKLIKTKKLIKE